MRRLLALAAVATALAVSAAPAVAEEPIVEFPLCTPDGFCDRTCGVYTKPGYLRCGYGV